MADDSDISRQLQLTIRRQLDERDLSLKAISLDSKIPYSTLLSYFPGERDAVPAVMSVTALRKLTGHVPADLLSLLLPDNWQILRASEGIDHDEVAAMLRDYLSKKDEAHRPDSPAGREISDCEDARLRATLAVIQGGRIAA